MKAVFALFPRLSLFLESLNFRDSSLLLKFPIWNLSSAFVFFNSAADPMVAILLTTLTCGPKMPQLRIRIRVQNWLFLIFLPQILLAKFDLDSEAGSPTRSIITSSFLAFTSNLVASINCYFTPLIASILTLPFILADRQRFRYLLDADYVLNSQLVTTLFFPDSVPLGSSK